MPTPKMHADEVETDEALVSRLMAAQFPRWAKLPIAAVTPAGTDNALYRLGDDLVVRLPRIESAAHQIDKEHRWLPLMAPHLPLAIPFPLAQGQPGEGFPWRWSVYRWLDGENATLDRLVDPRRAAAQLARFITALQRLDATDGPITGSHNFGRGLPLASRDTATRAAIAACQGLINTDAALAAWERDLNAPAWNGPPVWIHGDIQSGNLLANAGELTAVIDFGGLAVGDPATDLMVAWNLFPADIREVFRAEIAADDATWARGRGWALSVAVIALPYYQQTNPALAGISRFAIEHVLADQGSGSGGTDLTNSEAMDPPSK